MASVVREALNEAPNALDVETWLPVPEYEGFYEVSNLGRVRSLSRMVNGGSGMRLFPGRIRKQSIGTHGYFVVSLSREGVVKVNSIHCLVLLAFRGNPSLGEEGCHEDGDELNNALSNLCWGTRLKNIQDKLKHGTQLLGSSMWNAILNEAKVAEIKRALLRGDRQADLCRQYGVAIETIHSIKMGKSWRHV